MSINRRMDKDVVYIYTVEYYVAIKRKKIGSLEEPWMDLESIIQSEVSQKNKNKYYILIRTCEIKKVKTDDLIHKAERETWM